MTTHDSPFHVGSLQSGISLAIQQQKLVACFIHGADDISDLWMTQFNSRRSKQSTSTTGESIATKAVLLRLELGSQEANFLNAFCPITQAPMLIFILNGQVLERIDGSVGEDEWFDRVEKVTGVVIGGGRIDEQEDFTHGSANPVEQPADATTRSESARVGASQGSSQPAVSDIPPSVTPTGVATQSTTQETTPMTALFPDRARKSEEEKKKREEAEKAERLARQNARRKEAEEAHAMHTGKTGGSLDKEKARRDWIVQQKQRKDEAKRERERILAQIEADKTERKVRAQQTREEMVGASSPMKEASVAATKRTMGAGGRCDLSVRLFDGSSIRGRFEPKATLGKTVRDWIKEETGDGYDPQRPPYTFRQILAPQPSRSIDVTEEQRTLAELDMVPTSTLILIPVSGYQDAYSSGSSGLLARLSHVSYAALLWLWTLLSSFLTATLGTQAERVSENSPLQNVSDANNATSSDSEMSSMTARVKMKTLADQRAERASEDEAETEFYNGNSLGFEGRKDEDVEESKSK